MSGDPRVDEYAKLLVGRCIDVQPGWQVLLVGSPLARPLLEQVAVEAARRGAYALMRVSFAGGIGIQDYGWIREAPLDLLAKPPALERRALEECDDDRCGQRSREHACGGFRGGRAPSRRSGCHSACDGARAPPRSIRPAMERVLRHEVPWVACQYPTPALAQEAGMGSEEFADFLPPSLRGRPRRGRIGGDE